MGEKIKGCQYFLKVGYCMLAYGVQLETQLPNHQMIGFINTLSGLSNGLISIIYTEPVEILNLGGAKKQKVGCMPAKPLHNTTLNNT